MTHPGKDSRRRQFLLVLPLLIIPFLTLAFWAMGGGKRAVPDKMRDQLNTTLPDAAFKKPTLGDKLSLYEQARSDSSKRSEAIKHDPYRLAFRDSGIAGHPAQAASEAALYAKLEQLNKLVEQPGQVSTLSSPATTTSHGLPLTHNRRYTDRSFDHAANTLPVYEPGTAATPDPQLTQLSGMLDKILDIQHPDRVKQRLDPANGAVDHGGYEGSLPASAASLVATTSVLGTGGHAGERGFESETVVAPGNTAHAITAVIHGTQTIRSGSVVKLRLTEALQVGPVRIPKGQFLAGTASVQQERLMVTVTGVLFKQFINHVKLVAHDLDGLPGLYIPGSITRDVTKQSADNAIQSVALNSLDPGIGAQAAAAGIETAKKLLSRKVKQVKVVVPAGYRVLLINRSDKP